MDNEILNFYNKRKNTVYEAMCEFYSNLTEELDVALNDTHINESRHYVLANDYCLKNRCLAIRFPGMTVGNIQFDEKNIIRSIIVDSWPITGRYPENINTQLQKYIGKQIQFN